ncbi:hypothetical protein FOA52_005345 [Chlamydomonas sp. UWO 241]|nr:hypothetical protein FOA52_005345 [Chlamydomonas sp. UWO 241]
MNHTSNTAFPGDNYTADVRGRGMPHGYRQMFLGEDGAPAHPCYDPQKDLVLPSFKAPPHYKISPLAGKTPLVRDVLFFFKGDVGKGFRAPNYSNGVRQRLYKLWLDNDWKTKHNVWIGDRHDVPGEYSDMLARSKFCLVAPGDGWSGRVEDSILHGCVPVVIMDGAHVVFETILDWPQFSIKIPEADINRTIEILLDVKPRRLRSMQAHLARVWNRFRWVGGPALQAAAGRQLRENLAEHDKLREERVRQEAEQKKADAAAATGAGDDTHDTHGGVQLPRPFRGDPSTDDAFGTLMQWLHSRIPMTRE